MLTLPASDCNILKLKYSITCEHSSVIDKDDLN